MGLMDFKPFVRVRINSSPISSFLFSHISSVRITDASGFMSDTAEVTFANISSFNQISMPQPGAELSFALGYQGDFRDMGIFIADEVEESSPPRKITIVCRAKAQGASLAGMKRITQHKTRSWRAGLSLKDIATTIADENGLKAAVTSEAAALTLGHIDQIDESDMSVLTRIALTYDLIAKPAGGRLFVGRRTDAITASGQPMPLTFLNERDVSRWSMRRSLGHAVGSVIATYRDIKQAKDIEVRAGDREPTRRLRGRFRNEDEARSAANIEARRAGRAVETLDVEMPGNPNIVAESRVVMADFSSASAGEWVVHTTTHELSDAGYKTRLQAIRSK